MKREEWNKLPNGTAVIYEFNDFENSKDLNVKINNKEILTVRDMSKIVYSQEGFIFPADVLNALSLAPEHLQVF